MHREDFIVPKVKKRKRGLALPEVLICLTVCSLLLTATALAFSASVHSYRDNQDRNQLLSNGKLALKQIIRDIRVADAHAPINDSAQTNATTLFAAGTATENSGIQVVFKTPSQEYPSVSASNSATWVYLKYSFNSTNKTIEITKQVGNGTPVTTTAARFVQDFRVRMEPARSTANVYSGNATYDILLRGVVTISLQNVDANGKMIDKQGNQDVTVRLTDAAMPRKAFSGL
jgi:Tfp pilus assembly protein PilW